MDIGSMLGDAFEYTREAFVGKWTRWLILLVGTIVFPVLLGYTYLVYRGERTPPDPQDWVAVFVDGLKLFVVQLVYGIPVAVISIAANLAYLVPVSVVSGPADPAYVPATDTGWAVMAVVMLVVIALAILVALVSLIASVRLSRTGSFGEAFNFRAILEHIGRIGWGDYVVALVGLYLAIFIFVLAMMLLGIFTLGIGFVLYFVLSPALSVFVARYVALIYDSAPAPA